MMAIAIVGVKSILEEIGPLKVTKGKTAENRAAPMQADGHLFLNRGIAGGCALRFLPSQTKTFHRLPNIRAQYLTIDRIPIAEKVQYFLTPEHAVGKSEIYQVATVAALK
jgi:hypothetical protein